MMNKTFYSLISLHIALYLILLKRAVNFSMNKWSSLYI